MSHPRVFFAQDTVVKIVLKEGASTSPSVTTSTDNDTTGAVASPPKTSQSENKGEYYIHKILLSSLSPELDKHTNNEMKEGREGVLELTGVDGPTMEAFIEWAYFKDYKIDPPNSWLTILPHTKVYVLADRFNLTILNDLGFFKIKSVFSHLRSISDMADISSLLEAVAYGCDNLLLRTTALAQDEDNISDPIDDKTERLLKHFARFIAWSLKTFQGKAGLRKLIENFPDFAEMVMSMSSPAVFSPWMLEQLDTSSTATARGEIARLWSVTPQNSDSSHILWRYCSSCNMGGVASIKCRSCDRYDYYIGLNLKFGSVKIGNTGNERVCGTKTDFSHTCWYCEATSEYGTDLVELFHPKEGLQDPCTENIAFLSCAGCGLEGYWGCLSID